MTPTWLACHMEARAYARLSADAAFGLLKKLLSWKPSLGALAIIRPLDRHRLLAELHIGTCMHAVCAGAEAHARERKADPRSDHGLYIMRTYGSVPERARGARYIVSIEAWKGRAGLNEARLRRALPMHA